MTIRDALHRLGRRVRGAQRSIRHRLRLYDSPDRLAADAQSYWTAGAGQGAPEAFFHLRGHDMFEDDEVWLRLGRAHFELFEGLARMLDVAQPMARILEWGCGGGANAVHFARIADEFVGVDVSRSALDECAAQLAREGIGGFVPALVDVRDHADVVARFAGTCDLFLCTYVFELLPSPQHGAQLLAAAADLLRPGGVALIQIKYVTADPGTRHRSWDYRAQPTFMTSYPIDEFWTLAEGVGLTPRAVVLRPKAPEVDDERYAYFALVKGGSSVWES